VPLYEYRCNQCGYQFEKIQKFSDEPERVCPKCQGELVRPMTAPALKFEGAGWYINDYSAKGSAKAGENTNTSPGSETKTESKSSEAGGSSTASPASTPATTPASTPAASAPASSSPSSSN
jgi:putative FmdB family regulatory protein